MNAFRLFGEFLVWAGPPTGRFGWWLLRTPTVRCERLLPGLSAFYWSAVWWGFAQAALGWAAIPGIFRGGEDYWAFRPRPSGDREEWLGQGPLRLIRFRLRVVARVAWVRWSCWRVSVCLLVVGWAGWLVLVPPLVFLIAEARRRRRVAWWA